MPPVWVRIYRNFYSLPAIANVVYQGINYTKDPEIYKIGMEIIKKYLPHLIFLKSHIDGAPDRT